MSREYSNWAGDVKFTPAVVEQPADEEAVAAVVRKALEQRKTVRVIGSGHSSNPLPATDDILVLTEKLSGPVLVDADNCEATVPAGMTLHDINEALFEQGWMFPNLGDIDAQALAGAVATGTHGSGKRFTNLSGMIRGGRLVAGTGEVIEFSESSNPELLQAARVAVGTLGIFTMLTLRVARAEKLIRQEWCTHIDICTEHIEQLVGSGFSMRRYAALTAKQPVNSVLTDR